MAKLQGGRLRALSPWREVDSEGTLEGLAALAMAPLRVTSAVRVLFSAFSFFAFCFLLLAFAFRAQERSV